MQVRKKGVTVICIKVGVKYPVGSSVIEYRHLKLKGHQLLLEEI